jgi:hypothetical protein
VIELQEIYDRTVTHLHAQGGPAFRDERKKECAYRGRHDRRCAVGYWIPDELYDPSMESHPLTLIGACAPQGGRKLLLDVVRSAMGDSSNMEWAIYRDLLDSLQQAHDFSPSTQDDAPMWIVPGGIVPSLREIAERFKLDSSVVDRLFTW